MSLTLTADERRRLKTMACGHSIPHQTLQCTTIVLPAALGSSNVWISAQAQLRVNTARIWRGRFATGGLPALADRRRSGRPTSFTTLQVRRGQGAWSVTQRDGAPAVAPFWPEGGRVRSQEWYCRGFSASCLSRRMSGSAPSIRRPPQRHGTAVPVEFTTSGLGELPARLDRHTLGRQVEPPPVPSRDQPVKDFERRPLCPIKFEGSTTPTRQRLKRTNLTAFSLLLSRREVTY